MISWLSQGNPLFTSRFQAKRVGDTEPDALFVISLNKLLNKLLSCRWTEMHLLSYDATAPIIADKFTVWFNYVFGIQLRNVQNSTLLALCASTRADSGFAPSQWEMALLCNDVSHWLGAKLKSVLIDAGEGELLTSSRDPSQYKDNLSRYGYSHYKDKMVIRPSYLYNGKPYTGKTPSLCWDSPLDFHTTSKDTYTWGQVMDRRKSNWHCALCC